MERQALALAPPAYPGSIQGHGFSHRVYPTTLLWVARAKPHTAQAKASPWTKATSAWRRPEATGETRCGK
jgi:hypothetical protein